MTSQDQDLSSSNENISPTFTFQVNQISQNGLTGAFLRLQSPAPADKATAALLAIPARFFYSSCHYKPPVFPRSA
jgi:hypothetical protein